MLVKIIQAGDTRIVTCLGTDEEDGLQFYCQDSQNQNYCEHLAKSELMKRLKDLNKRVQFPIDAVHQTLATKEPVEAVLSKTEGDDRCKLITLKYRMEATIAPFKWEWHIRAIDKAKFYHYIAMDSISKASQLSSEMSMLMQLVQKKDIELKQYRIEGSQLRRTTVATEPFNFENYKLQHDVLLTEAASYGQLSGVFESTLSEDQIHFSPLPRDVKAKTPTPSSTSNASKIQSISPRNRKRMALEKSTNHLEKKILQRQREPHLQYKDTQSPEEDLDDWLTPNTKQIKTEDSVKSETTTNEEVLQNDVSTVQEEEIEEENSNELKDLLAILDRTSKANEEMIKQAKKEKLNKNLMIFV
ncbi:uncharacterized protein [Drosophila tropicalis]|uniref:uncharacterized protein n=1 Tax=Drosophila tropicalis TaxID=46794 RepID=UPI0035AB7FA8